MSEEKGFQFFKVLQNFEKVKNELPITLANQAQNHFANSFRDQGWNGEEWATPKRRIEGTSEYKYPKSGAQRTRATLVKSGALRRAVQNSIRSATFDRVQLVIAIPYAVYHNDGTDKIPKRQFMGQSHQLTRMQLKTISDYVDKIW